MNKKDVLLIANYWHMESEKASSRYRSFADLLCKSFDLEVVTSTFCHLKKSQRNIEDFDLASLPYKMKFCFEKGYRKNISLKRIKSYKQFGKSVLEYLKVRKKPDAVVVSVPSLSVADYVTRFCNENNIPVIVDIQDLWPEAFKMAINIPVVSDVLFAPMKRQADKIYSRADVIMAVSNTYVERGKSQNPKAEELSIYIGTDSALVEEKTRDITVEKPEGEFWIGYVGALGHSYDIKAVIDAIKLLDDSVKSSIVFKVMGDGVLREEFEEYARKSQVNCHFTGLLEYGLMMQTLKACDVAVNPIIGTSVSSIINKVSDYAAAGVPVINTQNSAEYRSLLEQNEAGINVKNGDVNELASAISALYSDKELCAKMGKNSLKMYDELFDRQKTYPKLTKTIERLISGK